MNNRLLHTPEGVRDIYGKEYAKKLAVETGKPLWEILKNDGKSGKLI